jgi:hypothetical protein
MTIFHRNSFAKWVANFFSRSRSCLVSASSLRSRASSTSGSVGTRYPLQTSANFPARCALTHCADCFWVPTAVWLPLLCPTPTLPISRLPPEIPVCISLVVCVPSLPPFVPFCESEDSIFSGRRHPSIPRSCRSSFVGWIG